MNICRRSTGPLHSTFEVVKLLLWAAALRLDEMLHLLYGIPLDTCEFGMRHHSSCKASKGVALALPQSCVQEDDVNLTYNAEYQAHHQDHYWSWQAPFQILLRLRHCLLYHHVAARVRFISRIGRFLLAHLSCHVVTLLIGVWYFYCNHWCMYIGELSLRFWNMMYVSPQRYVLMVTSWYPLQGRTKVLATLSWSVQPDCKFNLRNAILTKCGHMQFTSTVASRHAFVWYQETNLAR